MPPKKNTEASVADHAAEVLEVTDETAQVDETTFDLDAWINGVEPTIRAIKLYQKAGLLSRYDELDAQYRVTKNIPAEERGVNDPSPDSVEEEMIAVLEELESSAVWFKVQGMSDDAREAIEKPLKKKGVGDEDTQLQVLAQAIVSPQGVTPAHLRQLGQQSEVQLKMLLTAFQFACTAPPRVSAPLSGSSSGGRNTQAR